MLLDQRYTVTMLTGDNKQEPNMSSDIGIQFISVHGQNRSRPYKCPFCGTAFSRFEHRTRHIRTHTREKPYECQHPGCTRRFPRLDELKRHARMHDRPPKRRTSSEKHAATQEPECNEALLVGSSSTTMQSLPKAAKSRSALAGPVSLPSISSRSSPTFNTYRHSLPTSSTKTQASNITHPAPTAAQATLQSRTPSANYPLHSPPQTRPTSHNRLPSLSAYAISRSHSPSSSSSYYSYRPTQTSPSSSRTSTNPSSPTHRHASLSSTPDAMLISASAAAAHHLKPYDGCYDLPALRNLSLQCVPDLVAMEPVPLGMRG